MSATLNSRDKSINIWFNIQTENAKETFDKLFQMAYKDSIEAISPNLIWDKMEGRKMSAVTLKTTADFADKNDWNNQFKWFRIYIEKYIHYFKPIITKL